MHRPHLLDGYKYDLRLYVLLSSVQPLRIFLFREGLVRVCTQKYAPLEKNMGDTRMHLTNYSINKDADSFVQVFNGRAARRCPVTARCLPSASCDFLTS